MSKIIESFYEKSIIPSQLLDRKIAKLKMNPDIMAEFENWISSKQFPSNNAVEVEGYTAKKLSDISPLIKGEGAYMLLIELRDEPERALKRIQSGFKKK